MQYTAAMCFCGKRPCISFAQCSSKCAGPVCAGQLPSTACAVSCLAHPTQRTDLPPAAALATADASSGLGLVGVTPLACNRVASEQSEAAVHRVAACSGVWCATPESACQARLRSRLRTAAAPALLPHLGPTASASSAPLLPVSCLTLQASHLPNSPGEVGELMTRNTGTLIAPRGCACQVGDGGSSMHQWDGSGVSPFVNCCSDCASCNRSAATPAPSHGLSSASPATKHSSRYIFWAASCLKRCTHLLVVLRRPHIDEHCPPQLNLVKRLHIGVDVVQEAHRSGCDTRLGLQLLIY